MYNALCKLNMRLIIFIRFSIIKIYKYFFQGRIVYNWCILLNVIIFSAFCDSFYIISRHGYDQTVYFVVRKFSGLLSTHIKLPMTRIWSDAVWNFEKTYFIDEWGGKWKSLVTAYIHILRGRTNKHLYVYFSRFDF